LHNTPTERLTLRIVISFHHEETNSNASTTGVNEYALLSRVPASAITEISYDVHRRVGAAARRLRQGHHQAAFS
jgi:hypothetical protein